MFASTSDQAAPAHARIENTAPDRDDGAKTTLDLAILSNLADFVSLSKLEQIIRRYLIDVELRLARIVEARANRDFPKIDFEANSISQLALKLRAAQVVAAARRLKLACQNERYESVYPLISALNESCAAVSGSLRLWIADRR